MPFPFLLWGAAAVGAAVAGKAIYDAVTDEGSSSSTSSSSSGPSREEVQRRQLESVYKDFQKEFRKFWQDEDQLLCLKGQQGAAICESLPELVRQSEVSPDAALVKLHEIEKEKSCIGNIDLKNIEDFLSEKFSTCEKMTARINEALPWDVRGMMKSGAVAAPLIGAAMFGMCGKGTGGIAGAPLQAALLLEQVLGAQVDPDAPPRIAFADHYELCRDEGTLATLLAACAPERTGALPALPGDWPRLTGELAQRWKEAQDIEAAGAEGEEPRVVVCGMLKAGKSSLLNSLFDDPTNQHFPTARGRKTLKNQSEVHNGIRFVDTPGLDYNAGDTEEAKSAYAGADLLLFVHDGAKELEEIQLGFLQDLFAMHSDLEEKLLVAITSKDESGSQLEALKAKIAEKVRERCGFAPDIFAVENTSYRSEKEKVRASSGIPELRVAIENHCRDIGDRLAQQRAERRATAMEALTAALEAVARPIRKERKQLKEHHSSIRKSFAEMVRNKKTLADEVRS